MPGFSGLIVIDIIFIFQSRYLSLIIKKFFQRLVFSQNYRTFILVYICSQSDYSVSNIEELLFTLDKISLRNLPRGFPDARAQRGTKLFEKASRSMLSGGATLFF
jgi:hypothetical protein